MRSIPMAVLAALAALVVWPAPASSQSDAALDRARAILRTTPLIDGHNDLAWEIRTSKTAPRDVDAYDLSRPTRGQTDIARLRRGMVGAQFWSVYTPGEHPDSGFARVQLEQIDIARRLIARYPDDLALALSADDIEREFRGGAGGAGRIASLLGLEGGHAIENSLGALRAYYALGVRYLTLTHNATTDWADAAHGEPRHGGLTAFGREVVGEMNRLGMLVDLSHAAPSTMSDAIEASQAPVIFSHSSAGALVDVPRNVPDSILRKLTANGGVVMVTFVPSFVAKGRGRGRGRATLADVADHIEHVREVAGADHVGIGSDFDGMGPGPEGLEDVSTFPALFAELVRRGWSATDLRKLAGQNILRVLRAAEATARRLQRERPPSTATIEATR